METSPWDRRDQQITRCFTNVGAAHHFSWGRGTQSASSLGIMPEVIEFSDADFATQMHGLVCEAERALGDRKPLPKQAEKAGELETISGTESTAPAIPSFADMLRPLTQALQAVGRAAGEHTQILTRLDKSAISASGAEKDLPQVVTDLRAVVEQRNVVSRQMFDALHEELKSYKDGFLLDSVHRPMIRDLITLFDDLTQIHMQMSEPIASVHEAMQGHAATAELSKRLESIGLHLEHNLEFVLEVLARLEVSQLPPGSGKLDKRTQRAVAIEPAEDEGQDLVVLRSLKRGFLWKDRVIRAEEVVVKKWKPAFLMALKPTDE
jgi:molecular chaperone GrpE